MRVKPSIFSIIRNSLLVLCLIFTLVAGSFISFNYGYCKPNNKIVGNLGGSPIVDLQKAQVGYTLVSPIGETRAALDSGTGKKGAAYLVNMHGLPVHTWVLDHHIFTAMLSKNGNLWGAMFTEDLNPSLPPGATGGIQEIDWNGNVIWEYKNNLLHHDFDFLPNGNIIATVFEEVPPEIAKKIPGGMSGSELNGRMWGDALIEVNRNKEIVWKWRDYEHLVPQNYPLSPIEPRDEWGHTNSLRYLPSNPIDGTEAFIMSMRRIDKVVMIRKSDGEIIWESPTGMLSHQHDTTLLPNGNILTFDNNFYKKATPRLVLGSRVVEIDPKQNKIVWEFSSKGDIPGLGGSVAASRFWSVIGGGAQRLANGNTLILNTTSGMVFEVTPDKKLVWDYVVPFGAINIGPYPNNVTFEAHRYKEDEINWPAKLPKPVSQLNLFCDKLRLN